jgi:hypothetical protein
MFSLQQNQKTRGQKQVLPGRGVAQTMYTQVSKCKNDKINKKSRSYNGKKFKK